MIRIKDHKSYEDLQECNGLENGKLCNSLEPTAVLPTKFLRYFISHGILATESANPKSSITFSSTLETNKLAKWMSPEETSTA
jgi:hypothetical protein